MTVLPFGTVPPLSEFAQAFDGTFEFRATGEAVQWITGAINQGIDSKGVSIGSASRRDGNTLVVTILDPVSLHALIRRLIEIEADFVGFFDESPALVAGDILEKVGYKWEEIPEEADEQVEEQAEEADQLTDRQGGQEGA